MSIYQDIILDHYRNPRNFGTLEVPALSASLHNPLCGDKIRLDILFKENIAEEVKYSGQGCAISQAASSMLTEKVKGKTKEELINLNRDFMIKMLGIELSPNRIKCALLPLEALRKILNPKF